LKNLKEHCQKTLKMNLDEWENIIGIRKIN